MISCLMYEEKISLIGVVFHLAERMIRNALQVQTFVVKIPNKKKEGR